MHQRYRNVIADAGYESEENYLYLEKQGQQAYIKPSNYEISQKKKYRQDIGRRENMAYNAEEDSYTCANGKKLRVTGTRKQKTKTGYVVTKTQYTCEGCTDCPLKSKCIHGHNSKVPMEERSKHFEVSKQFQEKRAEALERIVTEKGIELRVNRSIQSEGTFGNIKENMIMSSARMNRAASPAARKTWTSATFLLSSRRTRCAMAPSMIMADNFCLNSKSIYPKRVEGSKIK